MILSISRRTDIPAFYTPWFMNRIREGYVLVRNPVVPNRLSKISLDPENVDFMVFWTKNPAPMIPYLKKINKISPFYFQFTINNYEKEIEPRVGKFGNRIEAFQDIADDFGSERLIWRYDPIFISDKYTVEWHIEQFQRIAERLWGYTETCVISFIDMYAGVKERVTPCGIRECTEQEIRKLAAAFVKIAKENDIRIQTCAESIDLGKYGIAHGKCIDEKRISMILGKEITAKKDNSQRSNCGCVKSVDIGQYSSCQHGCVYCYANKSGTIPGLFSHNERSPLLIGYPSSSDIVTEYKGESIITKIQGQQLSMFK